MKKSSHNSGHKKVLPKNAPRPILAVQVGSAMLYIVLMGCSPVNVHEPITQAIMRATPLHFGMKVSPDPEDNPIDPPEKFEGYHTGTDYEVTSMELASRVPIFAICDGPVVYSGFAEGYGGLLVQHCVLGGDKMTILYGHLSIESLVENGTQLEAGDEIGILADARSVDSGENRKHLHLGIHKGYSSEYLGYVQTEKELKNFVDVQDYLVPSPYGVTLKPYWEKSDD